MEDSLMKQLGRQLACIAKLDQVIIISGLFNTSLLSSSFQVHQQGNVQTFPFFITCLPCLFFSFFSCFIQWAVFQHLSYAPRLLYVSQCPVLSLRTLNAVRIKWMQVKVSIG